MNYKHTVSVILCLLLSISGITLLAQNNATTQSNQQDQATQQSQSGQQNFDDQGNANTPSTNQRANACYLGGTLAGFCDTQWEWECGWGVIRVENGLIPGALLSQQCQQFRMSPSTYNMFATPIPTFMGATVTGGTNTATASTNNNSTTISTTAVPTTQG